MTPVETPDPVLVVVDDALPDPEGYRAFALAQPYESYTLGLATFHGIAFAPPILTDLVQAIDATLPAATLTFFRKSPHRQAEPNYIHTDRSMGAWTALLYLTLDPPAEDGTVFWESRENGSRADASQAVDDYAAEGVKWAMTDAWQPWHRVAAKFNRLLLFPAPYYHSRAIFDNFGADDHSARLVNVAFGGLSICQ